MSDLATPDLGEPPERPVAACDERDARSVTPSVAVLIPAFEEEANVAPVVRAALAAGLGRVLVIDDGSADATGEVARAAGAEVLRLEENAGKGGALAAGAAHLSEDVVVLLDADLIGLEPHHVRELAEPVMRGEVQMTRGSFQGGRWRTTAAQQVVPQLSGQRALHREALLAVPGLAESRYGVEVAITRASKQHEWRSREVVLTGVTQVMKEEKHGTWSGLLARLKMYRDVLLAAVSRRGSPRGGDLGGQHRSERRRLP